MHDLLKLQVTNNQINFDLFSQTNPDLTLSALLAPVRPVYQTGQTGLACELLETQKSGVSGHLLGVSGLPSPENPDLTLECLDHHKPGVSDPMAGLSEPLPVRPVPPTGQTGTTQTKSWNPWRGENRPQILKPF